MRIDLGQLSFHDFRGEFPVAGSQVPARRVALYAAEGLRGTLATSPDGFELSELSAGRLQLSSLSWSFGKVGLETEQPATLSSLQGAVRQSAGELALQLELGGLEAGQLTLTVGELRLSGQLEAHGVSLAVGEGVGLLRFASARLRSFELHTASMHVRVPELSVSGLLVDWGGSAFRLEAELAEAAVLTLEQAGRTLRAGGVALSALHSLGAELTLGRVALERLEVQADLTPTQGEGERTEKASGGPLDLRLLDALAGRLHVDVRVDLTVPFLGRRQATHALRLGLEEGTLDYREFEHCLATLEDSLLDFSVREGALVLERGIPLLSTRGRGKPILIWELGADDLARAERRRVRLSLLPHYRLAGRSDSEAPRESEGGPSAFQLRSLSLLDIDAALSSTEAVAQGPISDLTFSRLRVTGELHHDPDGVPHPGLLRVTGESLQTTLSALALGTRRLSARLELATLPQAELAFAGLRPRSLTGAVEALTLTDLALK